MLIETDGLEVLRRTEERGEAMTQNVYNKIQMMHLLSAWEIVTGKPSLPERKGAQPVYLRLDAPTLNLVKIENIGKSLFRVTMITEQSGAARV